MIGCYLIRYFDDWVSHCYIVTKIIPDQFGRQGGGKEKIKLFQNGFFFLEQSIVYIFGCYQIYLNQGYIMNENNNTASINLQPTHQIDDEDIPLFQGQTRQTPSEQFLRQKNIAEEACQLGRKLLTEKDYTNASKQFSKAVMTFEYILKNNPKMSHLKEQIAHMVKTIIQPAYSNLSLCYLKMEHWSMVINFSNQVLQNDPSNVKNLYRRGIARKMSKMFEQAIEDFEKVITYDSEMRAECTKLIIESKQLKKQEKKKSKQWAKQFIDGYAADKPEPKPIVQTPTLTPPKESWWLRGLKFLSKCCPKLLGRK